MTLDDMRSELILLLGNRSTSIIPLTRYNLWLNNAQREIVGAVEVPEASTTATTAQVSGTALYDVDSTIMVLYGVRCEHNNRLLTPTNYRKLYNTDIDSSGDPTHWMREGTQFRVYPVPSFSSGSRNFTQRGAEVLTPMSATTDVPTLSEVWHECILLGGEYRGWRALREYQRYIAAKNEFLSMVRSRRTEDMIEDEHSDFGIQIRRS